ncbi:MAG: LamG-like jellyroll fold domain-containing protein, partial [Thermoplasmatota archaeon]
MNSRSPIWIMIITAMMLASSIPMFGTVDVGIGDQETPSELGGSLPETAGVYPFDMGGPLNVSFNASITENNEYYISEDFFVVNLTARGTNDIAAFIDMNETLLSWLRMDDRNTSSSPKLVLDATGDHNGTINGNMTFSGSGIFGQKAMFDGKDVFLNLGNDTELSRMSEITLEGWVKALDDGPVIYKGQSDKGKKVLISDDFSSNRVGTIWQTNLATPSEYRYVSGNLEHGGDRSTSDYFSSKDKFTLDDSEDVIVIKSTIDKEYSCSDHYFMITDNYNDGWSWGTSTDKFKFVWNCNSKYIYGPNFSPSRSSSATGKYDIEIRIMENSVGFWDSRTGWLNYSRGPGDYSIFNSGFYIQIGADDDSNYFSPFEYVDVFKEGDFGIGYSLSTNNGGEFVIGAPDNKLTAGGDITDGNWHHVAATYDGSYMKLYVDGAFKSQRAYTEGIPASIGNLSIGTAKDDITGSDLFYKGDMDDVKIFKRCLTSDEIKALYRSSKLVNLEENFTSLEEKQHTFKAYTQDSGGKVNSTDEIKVIVDTTVPRVDFVRGTIGGGKVLTSTSGKAEVLLEDANSVSSFIDVDRSLMNWWRMDDVSSGKIVDRVGGVNGTMAGSPKTSKYGYLGESIKFDGVDDYIHGSSSSHGFKNDTFTVSMFFRTETSGKILMSEGSGDKGWSLGVCCLGKISFLMHGGSSPAYSFFSDGKFDDGEWHHIVVMVQTSTSTFTDNKVQIYADSVLLSGTHLWDSGYNPTNSNWVIGARIGSNTSYWKGDIDDVVMFRRFLGTDEINALSGNRTGSTYSCLIDDMLDGDHTIKAYGQDRAGNLKSTEERHFKVEYMTTNVTVCRDLWRAGETYTLKNDINAPGDCIRIVADRITFNMDNYTISGLPNYRGIRCTSRDDIRIIHGTVEGFGTGVLFKDCERVRFENFSANDCRDFGISLNNIRELVLADIGIDGNEIGMDIISSPQVSLIRIDARNNDVKGIRIFNSDKLQLASCTFVNNQGIGLEVNNSVSSRILDNNLNGNGIGVSMINGCDGTLMDNMVGTSNSVMGIHFAGSSKNTIGNSTLTAGGIGLDLQNCHDNVLKTLKLSKNSVGIRLREGSNLNTVHGIDASDNAAYGVLLEDSDHNTVFDLMADGNGKAGFGVKNGFNNLINSSQFESNGIGVEVHGGGDNVVIDDRFHFNSIGISLLEGAVSTEITSNEIIGSDGYAITIDSALSWGKSRFNWIYLNNIENNNPSGSFQASDDGFFNTWNLTDMGNRWSDWTWPDMEPNGIVDEFYPIPGLAYSRDYYPLVDPIDLETLKLYVPMNRTIIEDVPYIGKCSVMNADGPVTWTFRTDADWLTFTPGHEIRGTATNDDVGFYFANITIEVGAVKLSREISIRVLNVNDEPVISGPEVTDLNEDVEYEFDFDAVDIDPTGDVLEWELFTNADFLSLDEAEGIVSASPHNGDVGSYWFRITVTDNYGGSDELMFEFDVLNFNDDPVIRTIPVTFCLEDEMYTQSFSATDEDPTSDIMTWSMTTDAAFLDIDPREGKVWGRPANDDVGVWALNITVDDGNGGLDHIEYILEVRNVNDGPVIITERLQDIYQGEELSRKMEVMDPDAGDEINWTMVTNAEFLTLDKKTGLLHGKPGNGDVGTWYLTLIVEDGKGGTDDKSLSLRVLNVNDPPEALEDTVDIEIKEDGFDITENVLDMFTDIDGDDLRYSLGVTEHLQVDILRKGEVYIRPEADWSGEESFELTAGDGTDETTITFNIKVLPVNDAPVDPRVSGPAVYYLDGDQTVTGSADDVDTAQGDTLTFRWNSNVSGFIGEGSTINLSLPAGYHTVTMTVIDSEGEIAMHQFEILVVDRTEVSKEVDEGMPLWPFLAVSIVVMVILLAAVIFVFIRGGGKKERKEPQELPPTEEELLPEPQAQAPELEDYSQDLQAFMPPEMDQKNLLKEAPQEMQDAPQPVMENGAPAPPTVE